MRDALLLVDLFNDFRHEDGGRLRRSFVESLPAMERLLGAARHARLPVIYANDRMGHWHGNLPRFLDEVLADVRREASLQSILPLADDAFLFKDRYSAFDHTALEVYLPQLGCERLLMAGMTLEACVTQTAIGARERGLMVSVVRDASPSIDPAAADVAADYLERIVGARVVGVEDAVAAAAARP